MSDGSERGQKGYSQGTMKLRLVITELSINPIHLPRARQRLKYLNPMQQEIEKPGTDARWGKHLETSMEESGVTGTRDRIWDSLTRKQRKREKRSC